ncbi:MAG: hypothetical protein J6038_02135, partial [Bacilli bacterium]|nr:hypothetical protein [Bacilli bacterium]
MVGEETVTFYSDLDKMKAEFLRVAPEDKKQINSFIRTIKRYQHVVIPYQRPMEYNNLFHWIKMGWKIAPMALEYLKAKKTGMEEYANRFRSPILRDVFHRIVNPKFNLHAFAYMIQALASNDAGWIQGGSSLFAKNIEENYLSLGGKFSF